MAFSADQQAMALMQIMNLLGPLRLFLEGMKEGIQCFDANVVCLGFGLEVTYIYIYEQTLDLAGHMWWWVIVKNVSYFKIWKICVIMEFNIYQKKTNYFYAQFIWS